MKFIPLVVRNLFRSRRRTILTVASIAMSIFIFAMLMSLPAIVNRILADRAVSLRLICTSSASFFYPLPSEYCRRIAAIPHVDAVSGSKIFFSTYRDPKNLVGGIAVDPDTIEQIWPDWGISHDEADKFRAARSAALVGRQLMNLYRWKVGDQITLRGTTYPVDITLDIVGALSGSSGDLAVLLRRDRLDEIVEKPGTVDLIWIKVDSSQAIPGVIAEIDENFAKSSAQTRTETELGLSQERMGQARVLLGGAKFLAAIVIFAVGLVAANTAAMAVRERLREFAVLRAIGFGRVVILLSLLAEGLAVGMAGGLAGCLAAIGMIRLLPYVSSQLGLFAFMLRPPDIVLVESFAVAATIGMLSSLIPAMLALRREISGELRAVV